MNAYPAENSEILKYIALCRQEIEAEKYDVAKNYAIRASLLNAREKGAFDAELNALYSEINQIAEPILAKAEEDVGIEHFIAAMSAFLDVSKKFSYVDSGKSAEKRLNEIKKEIAGRDWPSLVDKEAGDVFNDMMSTLSTSWKDKNPDASTKTPVKAVDIVRCMGDEERKALGHQIAQISALYGTTSYGQKVRELVVALKTAQISLD